MSDLSPNGTQAVDRAFSLLRLIASSRASGLRLAELSDQSGLNKPTARRLLVALVRAGFVEQTTTAGKYRLGPEIDVLTTLRTWDLRTIAEPTMQRLVAVTEDVVLLTIFSGGDSAIVARLEGSFPLRTHIGRVGDRHPAAVGAASIAMLAALDDELSDERLGNEKARLARYPKFTNARIRELVLEARKRGYALNPGLIFEGSWAMAVVVAEPGSLPIAALTIAALENRLTNERRKELLPIMQREAALLSNIVRSQHPGS
jgi:DNA-binding IclR family transcriptional regulator